jgi:hypothetical protein
MKIISLAIMIVQFLLYVARMIEKRGKINEARKAVADDLLIVADRIHERAALARSRANTNTDGMRDPYDRDDDKDTDKRSD